MRVERDKTALKPISLVHLSDFQDTISTGLREVPRAGKGRWLPWETASLSSEHAGMLVLRVSSLCLKSPFMWRLKSHFGGSPTRNWEESTRPAWPSSSLHLPRTSTSFTPPGVALPNPTRRTHSWLSLPHTPAQSPCLSNKKIFIKRHLQVLN